MQIVRMTVYRGLNHVTPVDVDVSVIAPGVGQIACIECEGTGDWTRFHPDPETLPGPLDCVECKGTGKRFVSIF